MHLLVVLLLSLLLAGVDGVPPVGAEVSQNYQYYLEQARDALARRDYQEAIEYLKQAHLSAPTASYPVEKIQLIQNYLNHSTGSNQESSQPPFQKHILFLALGKKALAQGDYENARRYFETASRIAPGNKEATHYLNLIKRSNEGRVKKIAGGAYEIPPVVVYADHKSDQQDNRKKTISDELAKFEETHSEPQLIVRDQSQFLPKVESATQNKSQSSVKEELPAARVEKGSGLRPAKSFAGTLTVSLDDTLWATQPKTNLRFELNRFLILESRNIDRFLVITSGFIEVERVDRDHLKITPKRIGQTYLHVWDERGRWTFNVEVIFSVQMSPGQAEVKPSDEQYADPFQFSYAVDGGTIYRGHDIPSAERESLTVQQTLAVVGDTPYGVVDGSVGFNKFQNSTERTNQTVGLSGVQVGPLSDVNIRGFDASKYFSALTFPGQYFRGILLEGKALGEQLGAVYVHGQDRYTYSFVSPGVVEDRRSYVEGARVVLYPNEENRYGFNYARGYGPARQPFLKDQVYSLDARHRFQKALVSGEVATNTDTLAETVTSKFSGDKATFRASFRDIDEDFTTATNLPSNQGEIGTLLSADWNDDRFEVTSNADIYQERLLSNPDDPKALNYDLDSSVHIPLGDTVSWSTSGYYLDTPGELSPRRNVRLVNDLNKRYEIWGSRELQTYVGSIYQRSRVSETPISNYDRYSATTGFRVNLIRNLNYYANYEYSWVDNLSSDEITNPSVINTGLNYSRQLTERLSGNVGFYYRNEENTQGTNSFLAGEDSITGSVGMSYRPTDNSEIFWDSRMRNVWRENPDNPAYNEIDVRWGLRSAWDLPISWSPHATIRGHVFKDINANGRFDADEPGLANVRVKVGKKEVVSDGKGQYHMDVRAKKVLVSPDLSTVPSGYVLTSPAVLAISIPLKTASVDFGFTTDSGIYGVVYYDQNEDQQPNEGDVFIQHVKIILDRTITEETQYDGTYFFKNVSGGQHTIRLDVNSLPIEYLPLVKVSNTVEVTEGTTYVYHIPLKKK